MRLWTEYSGRLHAIDYAEIRPQVSGTITQVKFADGQMVKQGDLLFVIDPRPYAAAVERDEAALVSAQSKVTLAKVQARRYNSLIQSHSVSQDELDNISNAAMGIAVFSGMLGVMFFGLILTPVFYVITRTVEKFVTGRPSMQRPVPVGETIEPATGL